MHSYSQTAPLAPMPYRKPATWWLKKVLLLLLLSPFALQAQTSYTWQQFSMGADLSYVNAIEDAGGIYKMNGKAGDPFRILRQAGCNTVRVRLWNDPASWQDTLNGGRIYHHLPDVIKTMKRAKDLGMAVNLDLHYSDDWADPQKQPTPAAWKNLNLAQLCDSVYAFTLRTLNQLHALNLTPEMIQVGNENNNGMLWPLGKVEKGNYTNFGALLNSGIRAVRDFSNGKSLKPKIIVHVAQLQEALPWLKGIMDAGVSDFDIVGLSHYYKWSTVHHMDSVSYYVSEVKKRSGREVMIVETAFPFTNKNNDKYNNLFYERDEKAAGYPFTIAGQKQYLTHLVKEIIEGGGTGIMTWEPAWITSKLNDRWGIGSSWENNAFFDFEGNLHAGAEFMTEQYEFAKKKKWSGKD